jgi:hypothetical protein
VLSAVLLAALDTSTSARRESPTRSTRSNSRARPLRGGVRSLEGRHPAPRWRVFRRPLRFSSDWNSGHIRLLARSLAESSAAAALHRSPGLSNRKENSLWSHGRSVGIPEPKRTPKKYRLAGPRGAARSVVVFVSDSPAIVKALVHARSFDVRGRSATTLVPRRTPTAARRSQADAAGCARHRGTGCTWIQVAPARWRRAVVARRASVSDRFIDGSSAITRAHLRTRSGGAVTSRAAHVPLHQPRGRTRGTPRSSAHAVPATARAREAALFARRTWRAARSPRTCGVPSASVI